MVNWRRLRPADFQYDFENDELAAHRVDYEQAGTPPRPSSINRAHRRGPSPQDYFSTEAGRRRQNHYGVGHMSSRKRSLSQEEIDERVIAQADDDSAWEKPVGVRPAKSMALALPSELVTRAAFCARMARAASVGDWLRRVVQERVEIEEAASARSQRSRKSGGRAGTPSPRHARPTHVKAKDLRRSG